MKVLGITGGLGSGKSTVCRVFTVLGIPVYEADAEVKKLYATDESLVASLMAAFPADLFSGGRPDTQKFAAYFFSQPVELEKLNGLVHPFVREHFRRWLAKQDAAYAVKEAAILFESGSDSDCDRTACISAPESLRTERVAVRDKRSRQEIKKILSRQMSDAEREARSDYILVNDGQQMILPQVLQVHRNMLRLQAEK